MTVSILSLSARGDNEVAVTFELREGEHIQKETFLISSVQMADWSLRRGESTRESYDLVSHGASVYYATKRGLYLLGYGSCSAQSLCRKLIAKGLSRDVAREAVAELSRAGYINEAADAKREAERCVAKAWGKRRVISALCAKGYSQEAIREAMNALEDDGVDYVALCVEQIRKRGGVVPSSPAERQRQIAALTRYGFSSAEIREAFTCLRDEQ